MTVYTTPRDSRKYLTQRYPFWLASLVFSVCYAVSLVLHYSLLGGRDLAVDSVSNAFALLFVLALAIERTLQPFAKYLGPDSGVARKALRTEKARLDSNTVAVAGGHGAADALGEQAQNVAEAQHDVDSFRDATSVAAWACASGLGFLFSSLSSVGLLHIVLIGDKPWVPVDILVTGLVIGSGTKPLNDLLTRLQAKRN